MEGLGTEKQGNRKVLEYSLVNTVVTAKVTERGNLFTLGRGKG